MVGCVGWLFRMVFLVGCGLGFGSLVVGVVWFGWFGGVGGGWVFVWGGVDGGVTQTRTA